MEKNRKSLSKPGSDKLEQASPKGDIQKFIKVARKTAAAPAGRLLFALDATMSRQPTWDRACTIQSAMFETAASASGLSVQLIYFRGNGECRASKWVTSGNALARMMTTIDCRGGTTQIRKVLSHAISETREKRISAMVFIGDAMEENIDELCGKAGQLGLMGVKAFMFQEGNDPLAEQAFREIARLTNGAYMRLSGNSAKELEELLRAVAAFAAGGQKALEAQGGKKANLLIEQLKR